MKNRELKELIYNNIYQNASEGYVLTPSELAFEMVSTLPNDVFVSSDTTFLDPICKSGTFLFEIAEKLYNRGHSIGNIEKRIYTIDNNSHSLNVANRYIKKILNKESGSFSMDFKSDFSESFFNSACDVVSGGRFKTFSEFINTILIEKNKSYLMTDLKLNVSEFIERYEKVSKLESKLFGEVFTPRQLIDEMLDTLPAEVWTNKDLKWLDPAVGIGNFPAAIVDRLMVGLKDEILVDSDRYKWIMEEMLYMCDISIKNLFLLYKLFDANNEFKLNVYRGSFLEDKFDNHMKEVWGLEGFDVVVGNPPYMRNLHLDFILNSYKFSNIILMVHPNSWLIDQKNHTKIYSKVKDLIKSDLQKCIFINPNKAFGIKLSSPCTITLINKSYKGSIEVEDKINDNICFYKNIKDINKWNNSNEYTSIVNKVDNYIKKSGNITDYFGDNNYDYYVNISRVRGNIDNSFDNLYSKDFFTILPREEKVKKEFNKSFCMNFESINNAENFISYLKSDITRFFYSINKNDLSNNKIDMRRIPFIDFNMKWTDEDLLREFNINKLEYEFIKSVIPNYY
jgi:hypothetical protein